VIAADGSVSEVLYTLGTSRKGQLWETTAVPEIRVQAASLVREFREIWLWLTIHRSSYL